MTRLARLVLILLWLPAVLAAETRPPAAAIASAHPLATQAGHEILAQGGNAFDAAVAVAATLAVVEPHGSGLGGGGFFLLRRADDGYETMIDARERAPLAATKDMYLDEDGRPLPRASLDGPLAAAIPGLPAAMVHLARHYGRLPLAKSLAPAIHHAEKGFSVSERYRRLADIRHRALQTSPEATGVFLEEGRTPAVGYLVRQHDLAQTLRAIANKGRAGFYAGPVAQALVKGVREAGGIWTLDDLAQYRVKERKPLHGRYRGMRVTTVPLPSSGGVVLLQAFNVLEGFALGRLPRWQRHHLVIETMRLAYRDRAQYLGDSDYVRVPVARLISRDHAASQRRLIRREHATPSDRLPGIAGRAQGEDTTHFSIVDREGNLVAATMSINYPFGCGFIPPGTGVVLNNEMDDFVIKPGLPNVYGLVGNRANAIAPGKRPLSSMTPSFLETDDAVVVLGTPGGSRIISMVLLAALEFAHRRGGVRDWVALPRFHHQYLPDRVIYEPGAFAPDEVTALKRAGHDMKERQSTYGERSATYGNMQAVVWHKPAKRIEAASDPRGEGMAQVR